MNFNDTLRALTDEAIRTSLAEIEAEFQRRFGQAEAAPGVVEFNAAGLWRDAYVAVYGCELSHPQEMYQNAYDVIDRAFQTLARQHGAREPWQSIESAPTNKAVQVHIPNADYYGNEGVYAAMLVDMGTGRRWMTFGWAVGRDCSADAQPTAWRYLPAAPATDVGEKEK